MTCEAMHELLVEPAQEELLKRLKELEIEVAALRSLVKNSIPSSNPPDETI